MEEELRNTLEATDQNAQYDACAKRILGNKQILARIVKATIPGFQDMKPSEIIPYIEGEPLIGNVRIEPGLTNPSMTAISFMKETYPLHKNSKKRSFGFSFCFLKIFRFYKYQANITKGEKKCLKYNYGGNFL